MTHRHQRGWLKKEKRSQGETWVLFFRTVRKSDGKRVQNKIPIFQLVLSKTSLVNTLRGERWKGNTCRSTRWISEDA
jgi:hypothetical protein